MYLCMFHQVVEFIFHDLDFVFTKGAFPFIKYSYEYIYIYIYIYRGI